MQAWFYEVQASGGQLLAEHDYLGSVEAMHLNDQWAAAIFEGGPAQSNMSEHICHVQKRAHEHCWLLLSTAKRAAHITTAALPLSVPANHEQMHGFSPQYQEDVGSSALFF